MTKYKAVLVILLVFICSATCQALDIDKFTYEFSQNLDVEEIWDEWLKPGEYFTMLSPDEEIIMQTARRIYVSDEYLTSDNKLYKVIDVSANTAYTEFVEEVKLSEQIISLSELRQSLGLSAAEAQGDDKSGIIGIYHTHNAESYVPSDGTESINGKGGIHTVGLTFAKTLNKLGVEADYFETLHLPHDRSAYRRSRNTVLELLAHNPDAIFDVHRDAAPKNAYAAEINDTLVTQIQFVVGRQNQNLGINRQYAQSLKAIADQVYPGLIKGIFYARGNYNQDLSPLNLLLEVGAHTNSKEAAARGVSLFAEVVDYYFYGPKEQRIDASNKGSIASLKTVFWVLILITATGTAFFVINSGGWKEALARLRRR
ncbi:MAG: stage II sporulation protein P [Firmicutes bacterium]|nr:stage II sporulation protein P [Bacillota bacterium]